MGVELDYFFVTLYLGKVPEIFIKDTFGTRKWLQVRPPTLDQRHEIVKKNLSRIVYYTMAYGDRCLVFLHCNTHDNLMSFIIVLKLYCPVWLIKSKYFLMGYFQKHTSNKTSGCNCIC